MEQVATTTEIAERFRDSLVEQYGRTAGHAVEHAEAFEISEYGRSLEEGKQIFPFLQ